jgi:hypothetical protein
LTKRLGSKMKNLSVCIAIIAIGLVFAPQCLSQRKNDAGFLSVRINKKLPAIFLVFEKTGVIKDASNRRQEKRTWFRLKNNSRWLIKLDASGGNKAVEDAQLYYEMLDDKGNIKVSRLCHVCSVIGLASGKSILFSVSSEEVSEASSFRIQFEYEWEDKIAVAPETEPSHYVYFYTRHLPSPKL